jgi:hypothetical protein
MTRPPNLPQREQLAGDARNVEPTGKYNARARFFGNTFDFWKNPGLGGVRIEQTGPRDVSRSL